MTRQEKAQELFDKYYLVCQEFTEEIQCSIQAKQCALIAVDEIVNCDNYFNTLAEAKEFINYWYEVQQEIEKL